MLLREILQLFLSSKYIKQRIANDQIKVNNELLYVQCFISQMQQIVLNEKNLFYTIYILHYSAQFFRSIQKTFLRVLYDRDSNATKFLSFENIFLYWEIILSAQDHCSVFSADNKKLVIMSATCFLSLRSLAQYLHKVNKSIKEPIVIIVADLLSIM